MWFLSEYIAKAEQREKTTKQVYENGDACICDSFCISKNQFANCEMWYGGQPSYADKKSFVRNRKSRTQFFYFQW